MLSSPPSAINRKDYSPSSYLVDAIDIAFDLDPAATRVATRMTLGRNPAGKGKDIVLYGEDLELVQLRMNGRILNSGDYQLEADTLRIAKAPLNVTLEVETVIHPDRNTSLMGLYVSDGNFFTQCEAEGFRRITYFPDRPDVMATYTVTLRADRKKFPVLLSNGNLIDQGDLPHGRHFAKWEDPFRKPSYLFALVAGKLVCQEEHFRLHSGRTALLQVWVEKGNLDKTAHAMESLKHSIRWDEERYGLELDLDRFMIVAVSDFNMGAMENKGLNIFNTKFVLANARIATDTDYMNIESVVGHEYFHNWTGNRVTCRDWFQLSLKEGLTVFRDQEFSADRMGTESGRAVKRIEDVRKLRQFQFPEDAGPMAHPVRPDSYVEINNFYTVTIYEKGGEVVRMYQTLLGREGFRKGMDLYFQRHDGQAVECSDFLAAMADANGRDLSQFERWYNQAGTPRVKLKTRYDALAKTFEVALSQSCPATPGQRRKKPFLIPFALGLLDSGGNDMPLLLGGGPPFEHDYSAAPTTVVLELSQARQSWTFTQIEEKPTISALRNFSAPVVLEYNYTDRELVQLLAHDSDHFNRWEAGQRLTMRRLLKLASAAHAGKKLELDPMVIDAFRAVLADSSLDPALRELILTLPSETVIGEQLDEIDPQAVFAARRFMRIELARALRPEWLDIYLAHQPTGTYHAEPHEAGRRSLKNLALSCLLELDELPHRELALSQFDVADNMTDRFAALTSLAHSSIPAARKLAAQCLRRNYRDYRKEALVIDKWFALQASAPSTDVAAIRKLAEHPDFTLKNPNRARSLIFSFCNNNPSQFHARDGSGYRFWAEQVITLDAINPQVAARLARSLDRWRKYAPELQAGMQDALRQVASHRLSKDVEEIVSKALAA
jgi:aminopeptidase N